MPIIPQSQGALPLPLQRTKLLPSVGWKWAAPRHTEQARGSGSLSPDPSHFVTAFTPSCRGSRRCQPLCLLTSSRFSALLTAALPICPLGSSQPLIHLLSSFQNVANLPSCPPRLDEFLSFFFFFLKISSLALGGILTGVESGRHIQSTSTHLILPQGIQAQSHLPGIRLEVSHPEVCLETMSSGILGGWG